MTPTARAIMDAARMNHFEEMTQLDILADYELQRLYRAIPHGPDRGKEAARRLAPQIWPLLLDHWKGRYPIADQLDPSRADELAMAWHLIERNQTIE